MVSWVLAGNDKSDSDFDNLARNSKKARDKNWNCLAELGVGLNPAIARLTGNPLYDEKCLGTVHVAIGDNQGFGRNIASRRHLDFVARRATIKLDSVDLMIDGRLNFTDLREFKSHFAPPHKTLRSTDHIKLSPVNVDINGPDVLRRLSSEGRINSIPVVSDLNSHSVRALAAELSDCLERNFSPTIGSLSELASLPYDEVSRAVNELLFYKMAELSP